MGKPIKLNDVESAENIRKRFGSGSMSHGALSAEAHETLAIAMNRIGAASCSGEGGEDPKRFIKMKVHVFYMVWELHRIPQLSENVFG